MDSKHRLNKFGSDEKYVGLTCRHRYHTDIVGVVVDGPALIEEVGDAITFPPGDDNSYIVKVRWDALRMKVCWINLTHVVVLTGLAPWVGEKGKTR